MGDAFIIQNIKPPQWQPTQATGGIINDVTIDGVLYRFHTFNTVGSNNFIINKKNNNNQIEYLIIGGGGGGGFGFYGAGGGAGGYISSVEGETSGGNTTVNPKFIVSETTYPIVIGNGGSGSTSSTSRGANGQNSSAFGFTAIGGGGAGSRNNSAAGTAANGSNGGSGGGGSFPTASGGTGTTNQGTKGSNISNASYGGGGGGSFNEGLNGTLNLCSYANGGLPTLSRITGQSVYRAGGGGGGGNSNSYSIGIGTGGAGQGGDYSGGTGANTAAAANSGSGGGGNGTNSSGSNGGSGVVIIRYPIENKEPVIQKYRYWRYVRGTTIISHHPNVSRIDLTGDGTTRLVTFASDNCSDSGQWNHNIFPPSPGYIDLGAGNEKRFTGATIFNVYGNGLSSQRRSANVSVQGSNDLSNWTTIFTGVAANYNQELNRSASSYGLYPIFQT